MTELREEPKHSPHFNIRARLRSFVFAGRGLRWLVREEHNAREHAAASLGTIVSGLVLKISASDWRWLVMAIAIV